MIRRAAPGPKPVPNPDPIPPMPDPQPDPSPFPGPKPTRLRNGRVPDPALSSLAGRLECAACRQTALYMSVVESSRSFAGSRQYPGMTPAVL